MDESPPLRGFISEWASYLERRGHRFKRDRGLPVVLRSENGRGMRYRWLLFHAGGPGLPLRAIEHAHIQRHLRLGTKAGELVYVVVKFGTPESKVLVVPAEQAATARQLRSDKGGIPWD